MKISRCTVCGKIDHKCTIYWVCCTVWAIVRCTVCVHCYCVSSFAILLFSFCSNRDFVDTFVCLCVSYKSRLPCGRILCCETFATYSVWMHAYVYVHTAHSMNTYVCMYKLYSLWIHMYVCSYILYSVWIHTYVCTYCTYSLWIRMYVHTFCRVYEYIICMFVCTYCTEYECIHIYIHTVQLYYICVNIQTVHHIYVLGSIHMYVHMCMYVSVFLFTSRQLLTPAPSKQSSKQPVLNALPHIPTNRFVCITVSIVTSALFIAVYIPNGETSV